MARIEPVSLPVCPVREVSRSYTARKAFWPGWRRIQPVKGGGYMALCLGLLLPHFTFLHCISSSFLHHFSTFFLHFSCLISSPPFCNSILQSLTKFHHLHYHFSSVYSFSSPSTRCGFFLLFVLNSWMLWIHSCVKCCDWRFIGDFEGFCSFLSCLHFGACVN